MDNKGVKSGLVRAIDRPQIPQSERPVMRPHFVFLPLLGVLAACSAQNEAPVTDASVRLPAISGRPGAAYFTLHGGDEGRTLVSVTSSQAGRAEMHDMSMDGGMMKMSPITGGVVVPKGETLSFASGGKHVMLYDMQAGLKDGDRISLTFKFQNGESVQVEAPAKSLTESGSHGH